MKELYFNLPGFFAQLKTFFLFLTETKYSSQLWSNWNLINFLVNMKFFLFLALATHIKILFALHVCDKKFIAEICICLLIKWKKKQLNVIECVSVCMSVGRQPSFYSVFLTCCVFSCTLKRSHSLKYITSCSLNSITIVRVWSFSLLAERKRRDSFFFLWMFKWTLELIHNIILHLWRLSVSFRLLWIGFVWF